MSRAISLREECKEATMESWMSGMMLIEATMLSFLVALWITWMSLRGLFRMLPASRLTPVPVRSAAQRSTEAIGHHAA